MIHHFPYFGIKKYLFLFDSHSRDDQGKISSDGTVILIKFTSLSQVQKYILENYLVDRGRESVFCQLQYIKVERDSNQNLMTQVEKNQYVTKESCLFLNVYNPMNTRKTLRKDVRIMQIIKIILSMLKCLKSCIKKYADKKRHSGV